MDIKDIMQKIDHTNLKQDAVSADIVKLCDEAKQYGFYSVIVQPSHTALAAECLKGSAVKCGAVIGFPFGSHTTDMKVADVKAMLKAGAEEIDMVMNLGALKEHKDGLVVKDIAAVVKTAKKRPVKVIIETCLLDEEQKIRAAKLCVLGGAAFVKTSTGFFGGGATAADVALLHKIVEGKIAVKAAGGVRTTEDALAMIKAGASRIGTSGGVKIAEGLAHTEGY